MPNQVTKLKLKKVLIINENLWEGEDNGYCSVSEAFKECLERFFSDAKTSKKFIFEPVTVMGTTQKALDKFNEFKPDCVLVEAQGLVKIKFADLVEQFLNSTHKPKEIALMNIDPSEGSSFTIDAVSRGIRIDYLQKTREGFRELIDLLENL